MWHQHPVHIQGFLWHSLWIIVMAKVIVPIHVLHKLDENVDDHQLYEPCRSPDTPAFWGRQNTLRIYVFTDSSVDILEIQYISVGALSDRCRLLERSNDGLWCILNVFSCDQAALRTPLSVCLSVCHTFFTMFLSSYRHKIFRSHYQWHKWCPCKRSRS